MFLLLLGPVSGSRDRRPAFGTSDSAAFRLHLMVRRAFASPPGYAARVLQAAMALALLGLLPPFASSWYTATATRKARMLLRTCASFFRNMIERLHFPQQAIMRKVVE